MTFFLQCSRAHGLIFPALSFFSPFAQSIFTIVSRSIQPYKVILTNLLFVIISLIYMCLTCQHACINGFFLSRKKKSRSQTENLCILRINSKVTVTCSDCSILVQQHHIFPLLQPILLDHKSSIYIVTQNLFLVKWRYTSSSASLIMGNFDCLSI